MNKVKFLLIGAIIVMCVGTVTGCGKKDTEDGSKASNGVSGSASEVLTNASKGTGELATVTTQTPTIR